MQIAQVSIRDLAGRIFNGHDLQIELNKRGISARQYVTEKSGNDSNTIACISLHEQEAWKRVKELEAFCSMDTLLYSNAARNIMNDYFYQQADIVHFHIIDEGAISLFEFAEMVKNKPSVWTIHDFWPMTGHCTCPMHPFDCKEYKTGCQKCPDIRRFFSMNADKAEQMYHIKEQLYKQLDMDIVVATEWMEQYVRESPLLSRFSRVHRIPFGVHLEKYGTVTQQEARIRLGVPENAFVLAFRADNSSNYTIKGTQYIWETLRSISEKITLITVGTEEAPEDIKENFSIIQLGWVNDADKMVDFFAACDVFLMPSAAETFGLMAVEAMASARPVIVFEDTVLTCITHAPECGVSVPYKSIDGLREAILRLLKNPQERVMRGRLGRDIAEQKYNFYDYVSKHVDLYSEIIERKNKHM